MPQPILIIGAGMAGLGAARYLHDNGHEVLVLEARDRIGGRILTDHTWGVPVDLGASLIHGSENNPIMELAQRYDVTAQPTFFDFDHAFLVDLTTHQPITLEAYQHWSDTFEELIKEADHYSHSLKQDISLEQALEHCLREKPNLIIPLQYYAWFLELIAGYIGYDASSLSARYWNQEVRLKGGHFFLSKGYKAIIDGLAEGIPIQLNTQVKRVDYSSREVTVETSKGIYTSPALVITLPLGVLKAYGVEFKPILPHQKQEAIQRLGLGLFNKVLLKFSKQFWPDSDFIGFLTEKYDSSFLFLNLAKHLHMPVLFAGMVGEAASMMEKQRDEDIVTRQLDLLRQVLNKEIPKPLDYKITRWSSDPFSLGAYSYLRTGSSAEDFDLLAEPVSDRLFFAGEATHRSYPGATHGAYLSGIKAAKMLLSSALG